MRAVGPLRVTLLCGAISLGVDTVVGGLGLSRWLHLLQRHVPRWTQAGASRRQVLKATPACLPPSSVGIHSTPRNLLLHSALCKMDPSVQLSINLENNFY